MTRFPEAFAPLPISPKSLVPRIHIQEFTGLPYPIRSVSTGEAELFSLGSRAPAGTTGVAQPQGALCQSDGIHSPLSSRTNTPHFFPAQGNLAWGSRTTTEEGKWRYINVRRLTARIARWVHHHLPWAVFQRNDSYPWGRVMNQPRAQAFRQATWRSSLMWKLSCTGLSRALLRGVLVATGLASAAAAPAWANTDRPAKPDPAALEAWRAAMAENPAQESGCFRESYLSLVRERVDCIAGSRKPVDSISRRLTNSALEEVGNTFDYVAETKEKTFWAGGSFLDVSVGSESSVDIDPWNSGTLGANEYALQLNTNNWGTTSAS